MGRGSYILRDVAHTPGAIDVSIRTSDGWILRGERLPDPSAPAVVVLGHAMMVDRRTMDRPAGNGLASELRAMGLDVLWLDVRGHGESGPRAEQGARWGYDDIVRHDVPAFVTAGREAARGRPVFLLGHSLVGHAGLISAGLSPDRAPDALVAYAANLWTAALEPSPLARIAKRATLLGWRALTELRGTFDPAPFGVGRTIESAGYVNDFTSIWSEGLGDYAAALERAQLDVLSVSSTGDRVFATPGSVRRFVRLARNARVETIVLEGDDAPDHMGFVTDPRSRALWRETARWILRRSA